MRTRSKLLLSGLAAALLLATAVASAPADLLRISNQRIRAVWSAFQFRTGGTSTTIRCPITIEGSFHSATIKKTRTALIGYITRATALSGACTGGSATVLQESLPWHLRYRGFGGVLPNFSRVVWDYTGAKWLFFTEGITCTGQTTVANPGIVEALIGEGGRVTAIHNNEEASIPLRGGFFCEIAGSGQVAGDGLTMLLGNTTSVFVTLI